MKEKKHLQENLQLSEYEKKVLQNIEERKQMFEVLVGDAKKNFMNTFKPTANEKAKATQRGLKRKIDKRYR